MFLTSATYNHKILLIDINGNLIEGKLFRVKLNTRKGVVNCIIYQKIINNSSNICNNIIEVKSFS